MGTDSNYRDYIQVPARLKVLVTCQFVFLEATVMAVDYCVRCITLILFSID